MHRLAARAATDPDVGHLMDAVRPARQRDALRRRALDRAGSLRELVDEFVERILAGVGRVGAASTTSVPRCWSNGCPACRRRWQCSTIRPVVMVCRWCSWRWRPAPVTVWCRVARRACSTTRRVVRCRGGASPVAGALPRHATVTGASFVEGFLAGSGTVLVHDGELLGVVDVWLSSLDPRRSTRSWRSCAERSARSNPPSDARS